MSGTIRAYSIRESLQGALQDFVRESGFSNVRTEELIRELVTLLAHYREEGSALYPEVFVFAATKDLAVLAPGGFSVTIGNAPVGADTAQMALKACATLATNGWAVFLAHGEAGIEYGIFRSKKHSLAAAAEQSLGDLGTGQPIVMVRNRGHLVVELINGLNETFTVALKTSKAEPSPLSMAASKFGHSAVADLVDSDHFRDYLIRLLIDVVQNCHGTLLAVALEPARQHEALQDGVWPSPAIDLANLHATALASQSADALADLQAAEAVMHGMIRSDGVVVFDTRGRVVAYRVFLKAFDHERSRIPEKGGGRRRAFELMKLRLGATLSAALFRSQDGETDFEEVHK